MMMLTQDPVTEEKMLETKVGSELTQEEGEEEDGEEEDGEEEGNNSKTGTELDESRVMKETLFEDIKKEITRNQISL